MAFDYSGSLAATGSGTPHRISEPFYLVLSGTWAGSVALEASADEGATWVNCVLPDGSNSAFTANGHFAVPNAYGRRVQYRVTFTRTSGTLSWRMCR